MVGVNVIRRIRFLDRDSWTEVIFYSVLPIPVQKVGRSFSGMGNFSSSGIIPGSHQAIHTYFTMQELILDSSFTLVGESTRSRLSILQNRQQRNC
jgi:hypothetical protein